MGAPIDPVKILLLISGLEDAYMHCGLLGFDEDRSALGEIKARYYKLYFKLCKEQGRKPF